MGVESTQETAGAVKVDRQLSTFTAFVFYSCGPTTNKVGPSGFEPLTSCTPNVFAEWSKSRESPVFY